MGTRGLITFRVNGENKARYQQWGAHAGEMGIDVLSFLRGKDLDILKQAAADLKVVSEETTPTVEQIEALKGYADVRVSTQSLDDWYCLLHKTQGDPEAILAAGYVEDYFSFGYDSLFCEWAVVVDLDAGNYDVYGGFNQTGKAEGLWAEAPTDPDSNGYGAVTRIGSFPLADLPTNEAFLAQVDPEASA